METTRQDLLRDHSKKEKFVIDFLKIAGNEIDPMFFAEDARKYIGTRSQFITAFSFADILANYWDFYCGNNERSSRARFVTWFNDFCLKENKIYIDNKSINAISVEAWSDLRNGLVHFFGMGLQKYDLKIILAANTVTDDELKSHKNIMPKNSVVIRPVELYRLFKQAGVLMLDHMISKINNEEKEERWTHIEGIDRVYQKCSTEGALTVIPNNENLS